MDKCKFFNQRKKTASYKIKLILKNTNNDCLSKIWKWKGEKLKEVLNYSKMKSLC